MMSVGAEGVVSVVGNVVPGSMIELVTAAAAGDFTRLETFIIDCLLCAVICLA